MSERNPTAREILGVGPDATPAEIERAYKRLIKKVHPDLAENDVERRRRTAEAARLNAARDELMGKRPSGRSAPRPGPARERSTGPTPGGGARARGAGGAGRTSPPPPPPPQPPPRTAPPVYTSTGGSGGRSGGRSALGGIFGVWVVVTVVFFVAAMARLLFGGPAPTPSPSPASGFTGARTVAWTAAATHGET